MAKRNANASPVVTIEWTATDEALVWSLEDMLLPDDVARARLAAAQLVAIPTPDIPHHFDAEAAAQKIILCLAQHFPPEQLYGLGQAIAETARSMGYRPRAARPKGSGDDAGESPARGLMAQGLNNREIARVLLDSGLVPSGASRNSDEARVARAVAAWRKKRP
jgi:hypothetical protein